VNRCPERTTPYCARLSAREEEEEEEEVVVVEEEDLFNSCIFSCITRIYIRL
jgi:hypothetical protein